VKSIEEIEADILVSTLYRNTNKYSFFRVNNFNFVVKLTFIHFRFVKIKLLHNQHYLWIFE